MGWNSTGKFGNHSGKTLRRYPTRKHGGASARLQCGAPKRRNEFAVVKELKYGYGARNVDPKSVKLDFEDGAIPLEKDSLIYSLNKHKRWLLPELLKEDVSELFYQESNENALDVDVETKKRKTKKLKKGSKQKADRKLRVSVVERHSSGDALRFRPDCIGVTSNTPLNSSDPGRKPSKKYSHVGDLKSKLGDEEIEVCYEFLSPFPTKEWPCNRQYRYYRRNSIDEVVGSKSKKKGKGKKNKCYLHGGQRDESFEVSDEFGSFDGGNGDSLQEHGSIPLKSEFAFPIGSYIQDAIKTKTKNDTDLEEKKPAAMIPSPVVYGKGQAIYTDNGEVSASNCAETDEIIYNPKASYDPLTKDDKFKITLAAEDVLCDNLFRNFGSNYIEGHVLPRKFLITPEVNETRTFDSIDDTCLLFEVFDSQTSNNTVAATVTFLLPKAELKANELECELNRLQNDGPPTVESIVEFLMKNIATHVEAMPKCISLTPKKSPAKFPVEFIQQVCKWESEVCDLRKAVQYALGREKGTGVSHSLLEGVNGSGNEKRFCEICYVEEEEEHSTDHSDFTCLCNCLHQFCNGCWSLYIASRIKAGQSQITCPCFNCKTIISEPLIWSHTNSKLYGQYRKLKLDHLISTEPQLQHCPAANCLQLAYIEGAEELETGKRHESVPVSCKCGLVWCFSCQNQTHWPATCEEMNAFCKAFIDYDKHLKMLRTPGLVSSVQVKKCPICRHPIEKSYGCDHMTCNCGAEFCWECLMPWDNHFWGCTDEKKEFEEVVLSLSTGSARFDKHCKIALRNNLERNGKNFFAFKLSTEKAKQVEKAHELASQNPKTSTGKFVQNYMEKNIATMVEDVFRFKNLAHFVLENTAVYLAIARTTKLIKSLERDMEQLDFITQRCHEVLLEPAALLQEEKLETCRGHLKRGEELIRHIDKLVQASRKQ